MYFNQGITIFDSTSVSNATTGGLVLFGGMSIFNTAQASSTSIGSVVLAGGIAVQKNAHIGGTANVTGITTVLNTVESTTSADGALVVAGGVGIAKDLNVGGDATITGNLFVNGTTTTVTSTTISVGDNTFQLNSGPAGSRDAGVLIQRYQVDNNAGTGDVVSDTAATSGTLSATNGTTTITLPASFSAVNDTYNSWWVKITSGTANNNVRQITDYDGTTKIATLSSALTATPADNTDTFALYNKSYFAQYFDVLSNEYTFGYTKDNVDITTDIYNSALANIRALGVMASNATITNVVATNMSAGTLAFNSAVVTSLNVTTNGTVNNAYINNGTVGALVVNNVNVTPSAGDIIKEVSFAAANNQTSAANVTGLAFANGTVRAFNAEVSVTILTTADADNRYATYHLSGVQKLSGWVLNTRFVGDVTGVTFSINASGQVQYISTNVTDFVSDTMKFKAETTSV